MPLEAPVTNATFPFNSIERIIVRLAVDQSGYSWGYGPNPTMTLGDAVHARVRWEPEVSQTDSSRSARPPCQETHCGTADKTLDEGSDPPCLDFAGDS